jgi:hypothetical protein
VLAGIKKNRLSGQAKAVSNIMHNGHLWAIWLYLEDWQVERGFKAGRDVSRTKVPGSRPGPGTESA